LKGLVFLRNIINNDGHFYLITFWTNIEAIKKFAVRILKGLNISGGQGLSLELEERANHYEVFAQQ